MNAPLRLLTLALFASSTFGLTNCKKDSEPEPQKPSQREIWLTTPGWRLETYAIVETTAAGVVTTTDYPLAAFDPCSLDDLSYYHADKSFTVDEGLVKCSAIFPGFLTSGTWAFASNETEIVVNPDRVGAAPVSIRNLTATTLIFASAPYTYPDGTTSVQIRTYSAH
ncbi:hypothetical protein ACVWYF_000823 [Hymenobacter sp. UYAg731]